MRVKIITFVVLTVLTLMVPLFVAAVPKDAINWKSYDEGLAIAKEQGKKIVIFFSADWCSYCAKMKKTTFQDEAIIRYLNDNYITIMVNSDKERKLVTTYKVRGLPTLWFLKPDATGLTMRPGYVDEEAFLIMLKYLHTDSYIKMSYKEFIESL